MQTQQRSQQHLEVGTRAHWTHHEGVVIRNDIYDCIRCTDRADHAHQCQWHGSGKRAGPTTVQGSKDNL
eukprot:14287367-Ditylum_brightwellii.AAC.1